MHENNREIFLHDAFPIFLKIHRLCDEVNRTYEYDLKNVQGLTEFHGSFEMEDK